MIKRALIGASVVLAVGVAAAGIPLAHADDGNSVSNKANQGVVRPTIIGGTEAGKLRFAVQVFAGKKHTCGGVQYGDRLVITAKHCLDGKKVGDITVRVGARTLGTGQEIGVDRWDVAEKTDIAVMHVAVAMNNPLIPALAESGSEPPLHVSVSVSGWGRTSVGGTRPAPKLKVATMIVGDVSDDARHVTLDWGNGMAWRGDSGGPVMYENRIMGIISAGFSQSRTVKVVNLGNKDVARFLGNAGVVKP
jgi:secreted trypsin-like serine protease